MTRNKKGKKEKRKILKPGSKTVRAMDEHEVKRLIELIKSKRELSGWVRKRDVMLVTWAVNTGLRVMDVVNLKVGQVFEQKVGSDISIIETKTGKPQTVTMTESMRKTLDEYLNTHYIVDGRSKAGLLEVPEELRSTMPFRLNVKRRHSLTFAQIMREPLFRSRKGGALRSDTVGDMMSRWAEELGLGGRLGAHSFRKAFGTIHYHRDKVGATVLATHFNHSSPAVSMRYLGITDRHVRDCRLQEIIKF